MMTEFSRKDIFQRPTFGLFLSLKLFCFFFNLLNQNICTAYLFSKSLYIFRRYKKTPLKSWAYCPVPVRVLSRRLKDVHGTVVPSDTAKGWEKIIYPAYNFGRTLNWDMNNTRYSPSGCKRMWKSVADFILALVFPLEETLMVSADSMGRYFSGDLQRTIRRGNPYADEYISKYLDPHVLPWMLFLGENCLLMYSRI